MRRKSRKKVKICRQRDGFFRERQLRIEARKMVGTMGLDSVYARLHFNFRLRKAER